ncbi:hypothetical protein ACHAW5_008734 [Stephanodiscus triporus]|uniref:J domain-containing protein n=1 Tax=Stephanodiscus triporus TaxID=2934178 RepID=A0ABD3MN97_9STRA
MSAPPSSLRDFAKDLYRLLRVPRTATHSEIKRSYREMALALHPDRGHGCAMRTEEFKEVCEAYRILGDASTRAEYDRWLVGAESGGRRRRSVAAERNPFYRRVYSPAAPPGMKTFDRQRHFDMHYGHGMMNEEIERARKRAEAASPRRAGSGGRSYASPLGAGFSFDERRPLREQTNPYSRRGERQHDDVVVGGAGGFRIVYEEAYVNMNGGSTDLVNGGARQRPTSGKEYVVERMKDRRKDRVRERGEPNPYRSSSRHDAGGGRGRADDDDDARSSGCVVM